MSIRNINIAMRQFWLYMQANFRNAMELKVAFWLDVIGMTINNTAFVAIWVFFFMKMGTVNGWTSIDAVGLNGVVAMVYGFSFAFAGGANTFASNVSNGNFDNYLLSPVNLYLRVISSYSKTSAFGDLLYGIILLTIFTIFTNLAPISILLLVILIPLCSLIMVNFMMVSSLIAFLIPDTAEVAGNLLDLMISPSLYPSGLFSTALRFFFLAIIPAIAISGAPVELVRNPSLSLFLIIAALSVLWTVLAFTLLKKAIRKYESGNLIGFKG